MYKSRLLSTMLFVMIDAVNLFEFGPNFRAGSKVRDENFLGRNSVVPWAYAKCFPWKQTMIFNWKEGILQNAVKHERKRFSSRRMCYHRYDTLLRKQQIRSPLKRWCYSFFYERTHFRTFFRSSFTEMDDWTKLHVLIRFPWHVSCSMKIK